MLGVLRMDKMHTLRTTPRMRALPGKLGTKRKMHVGPNTMGTRAAMQQQFQQFTAIRRTQEQMEKGSPLQMNGLREESGNAT